MKLVVTTDGSDRSLCVLPHAAAFAEAAGLPLVVMRVLDPWHDAGDEFALKLDEAIAKVSDRWRTELAPKIEAAGATAEIHIGQRKRGEDMYRSILREATDLDAGMLAMDTRGAGGAVRHALFGSVAMSVVSHTEMPVMTSGACIAVAEKPAPYHLLITADGSEGANAVFTEVGPLLAGGGVKVTLATIYEPKFGDAGDEPEMRKAHARLEGLRGRLPADIDVDIVVRRIEALGGVDTAIMEVAHDVGANAIAIATHGHSARYHLLAGSTALGIVKRSELPVILARSGA
ncbi:MAG: universal stress protein [Dehalococcoidia bacterium]|nr:universal stress protein [Dehalococcoidia bacterium]